jgi:hypothetical protein
VVASLPTFKVTLSHLDGSPDLGPTPPTSDVATWKSYSKPPLRGVDTSDSTNTRPAVNSSSPLRSTSARHHTRHAVYRLGRRLHSSPRLRPVACLLFYTGIQESAPTRPSTNLDPDNLFSTRKLLTPPPHDYPPSVCPTKPLPGVTLPQPGLTLRMPAARAAVERHSPTPLTPPDPDHASSEQGKTTPPFLRRTGATNAVVFSTPSRRTSLARLDNPFLYIAAAVAASSAKLVITTTTVTPTEFRQTNTDVAAFPVSTSARFPDRFYVLRRHESLYFLSRFAPTTWPL